MVHMNGATIKIEPHNNSGDQRSVIFPVSQISPSLDKPIDWKA